MAHPKPISTPTTKKMPPNMAKMKGLPSSARHPLNVVTEPWTVENALMTPTLKLRRPQLMQKYAAEIEAMYAKQ